jgi:hypothetical protein
MFGKFSYIIPTIKDCIIKINYKPFLLILSRILLLIPTITDYIIYKFIKSYKFIYYYIYTKLFFINNILLKGKKNILFNIILFIIIIQSLLYILYVYNYIIYIFIIYIIFIYIHKSIKFNIFKKLIFLIGYITFLIIDIIYIIYQSFLKYIIFGFKYILLYPLILLSFFLFIIKNPIIFLLLVEFFKTLILSLNKISINILYYIKYTYYMTYPDISLYIDQLIPVRELYNDLILMYDKDISANFLLWKDTLLNYDSSFIIKNSIFHNYRFFKKMIIGYVYIATKFIYYQINIFYLNMCTVIPSYFLYKSLTIDLIILIVSKIIFILLILFLVIIIIILYITIYLII